MWLSHQWGDWILVVTTGKGDLAQGISTHRRLRLPQRHNAAPATEPQTVLIQHKSGKIIIDNDTLNIYTPKTNEYPRKSDHFKIKIHRLPTIFQGQTRYFWVVFFVQREFIQSLTSPVFRGGFLSLTSTRKTKPSRFKSAPTFVIFGLPKTGHFGENLRIPSCH